MRWLVLVVALVLFPDKARAEDAPFAQYQYSRDTGQVRITTGFVDRQADEIRKGICGQ